MPLLNPTIFQISQTFFLSAAACAKVSILCWSLVFDYDYGYDYDYDYDYNIPCFTSKTKFPICGIFHENVRMLRAVANMIRSLHLRNSFVKPSFLAFPVFQAIEYRYSIFLVVSRFFQVLSFAFQAFHSLSGTFQVSPLSGPSGTFQDFF